jgi:hypothetical protein
MKRVTNGAWRWTRIAVLGVVLTGGSEARGGSIKITGSIVPLPGGPSYLYKFSLLLTGGSIQAGTDLNPTQFTVSGLVGVTGLAEHQEPPTTGNAPEVWAIPASGIVTSSTGNPPPYDSESSVTWQYVAGPTLTYTGIPISLGEFDVKTTASFPENSPPVTPYVTPIPYAFSFQQPVGGLSTGSGVLTLSSVPEPSSLVLLLAGGGAVRLLARWRRRPRSL